MMEITIVLILIGIMVAFAIPQFSTAIEKAKTGEARGVLSAIYQAQKARYLDTGQYAKGAVAGSLADYVTLPNATKHYNLIFARCGDDVSECASPPTDTESCGPSFGGSGTSYGYFGDLISTSSVYRYKLMILEDGRIVCEETIDHHCDELCVQLGFDPY